MKVASGVVLEVGAVRLDTGIAPGIACLTVQQQRFCPLCDRAFNDGEAVLRCEGCGVMQHPGCWVRHDGCATPGDHRKTPIAQAYSTVRPIGAAALHPGEGTRTAGAGAWTELRDPLQINPRQAGDEGLVIGDGEVAGDAGPLIGDLPPGYAGRSRPQADVPRTVTAPHAPRRYQPPPDGQPVRKPLPKVYGRHRLLAFWYVPVAILLAVGVAFGVIALAEMFSGDDDTTAASVSTGSPTADAAAGSPTADADASASASAGTTDAAGASSTRFKSGDVLVVAGAGDCLNVRVGPGVPTADHPNDAIVCLPDGSEVTVTGGPQDASGLHWWKVRTPQGEGWAAEDYLVKK